jgi:hypothetical protein
MIVLHWIQFGEADVSQGMEKTTEKKTGDQQLWVVSNVRLSS